MVPSIVKKFLKIFTVLFVVAIFFCVHLTISQVYESEKIIYKYGRICGRGALRSFQDESDMSKYSTSTGAMSASYNEYLNWLNTKSDYRNVVSYLRSGFADGLTPTNFSIPYVDKDILTIEFNQQLNMYMDKLEDESNLTMYSVDNIRGSVKLLTKEFQNFNTHGLMYGVNSSFKDNTTGHTRLYDYDSYVSYNAILQIDYDLRLKVADYFSITNDGRTRRTIEIPIRYELYN